MNSTSFTLQMFMLEFSPTSYFYGNLESSQIHFNLKMWCLFCYSGYFIVALFLTSESGAKGKWILRHEIMNRYMYTYKYICVYIYFPFLLSGSGLGAGQQPVVTVKHCLICAPDRNSSARTAALGLPSAWADKLGTATELLFDPLWWSLWSEKWYISQTTSGISHCHICSDHQWKTSVHRAVNLLPFISNQFT